jgi:hypothetical protein
VSMTLGNLKQPGYSTSLMGVLHAAADYYRMGLDVATIYGGTGHAFLMNVHKDLCPSSPYVWDHAPLHGLAANLGLVITDIASYERDTQLERRLQLEARIRELLDNGVVCGVINMDHQLIYGYEEARLLLAEPWGPMPITPPVLSSETWVEFGEEVHATFYRIERADAADPRTAAQEALRFAVELSEHPGRYAEPDYGMGPEAYRNWIEAVRAGKGNEHGAWWNGIVWSECRGHAAAYLRALADSSYGDSETTRSALYGAAASYHQIALELSNAADREQPAEEKIASLERARDEEASVVGSLPAVIELLNA